MMKHIQLLLLLYCFITNNPCKASASAPIADGMGSTGITMGDCWSSYQNPAGLSFIQNSFISLYQLNHFGIGEWNDIAICGGTEIKKHSFASLGLSQMGFNGYKSTALIASTSLQTSNKFRTGISLKGINEKIPGDLKNNTQDLVGSLGCIYECSAKLSLGLSINDISALNSSIRPNDLTIISGIKYQTSSNVFLIAEAESREQNIFFHTGMCYFPVPSIACRIGYTTTNNQIHAGLGFSFQRWSIDASCKLHPYLGVSSGISICYKISSHESQ